MKYIVQIILESSKYSQEGYNIKIIENYSFDSESDAKKKKKELIKQHNLEKIGYVYMNKKTYQLKTNF